MAGLFDFEGDPETERTRPVIPLAASPLTLLRSIAPAAAAASAATAAMLTDIGRSLREVRRAVRQ